MGGVMSATFIRYPEKETGTIGLFFSTPQMSKKNRLFCT
jgi:hypothetical protein